MLGHVFHCTWQQPPPAGIVYHGRVASEIQKHCEQTGLGCSSPDSLSTRTFSSSTHPGRVDPPHIGARGFSLHPLRSARYKLQLFVFSTSHQIFPPRPRRLGQILRGPSLRSGRRHAIFFNFVMRNTLIFSGSSCPALSGKICENLGQAPASAELSQFSNVRCLGRSVSSPPRLADLGMQSRERRVCAS